MREFLDHYPYLIMGLQVLYFAGILMLSVKIIMDTKTTSKTLAYLLLIIFLPVVGVLIYFFFGVNYRKNKFYNFKIVRNEKIYDEIKQFTQSSSDSVLAKHSQLLERYRSTFAFLNQATHSPLTDNNYVEVIKNGEAKFPKVLEAVKRAKHHIHLEYYIYESDNIGTQLGDLLIEKAKEGIIIRFLYDDLGSGKLSKDFISKLKNAGIEVAPVNKINFRIFANRANYRDHRKMIIIDGREVFTGGINVSDKYINDGKSALYWRDTHLYLKGSGAFYFQYLFLSNWVFATEKVPQLSRDYFDYQDFTGNQIVQVAASGPDSKPAIMMSTVSAIFAAKEKIYITTPYFIPVESVLQALKQMAISGVDIRLLVPAKGDSLIVNSAAFSYYQELLEVGIKIYFYEKGFVHAKTMIVDNDLSIIGTANMDIRSQELNFEVNTLVYDSEINKEMTSLFMNDLQDSKRINLEDWKKRPKIKIFFEHLARLFSPLL